MNYRFNYRLKMEHGAGEKRHGHTLEIVYCVKSSRAVQRFEETEHAFSQYLAQYQNKYLEDAEEFRGNTTIENIGEVLCAAMNQIARQQGYDLYHFEIGETPLRMYLISDEL